MRVLEAGGTVEQHKAAVAAATAMKFDGECDISIVIDSKCTTAIVID